MNELEFKRLAIAKRSYQYLLFYPKKLDNINTFNSKIIIDNANKIICLIDSKLEYLKPEVDLLNSLNIKYETKEITPSNLTHVLRNSLNKIFLESIGEFKTSVSDPVVLKAGIVEWPGYSDTLYEEVSGLNILNQTKIDDIKADLDISSIKSNLQFEFGNPISGSHFTSYGELLDKVCFNEKIPLIILPKNIDIKSIVESIKFEPITSDLFYVNDEIASEYKNIISEILNSNNFSIIEEEKIEAVGIIRIMRLAKLMDYDNLDLNAMDNAVLQMLNYIEIK